MIQILMRWEYIYNTLSAIKMVVLIPLGVPGEFKTAAFVSICPMVRILI